MSLQEYYNYSINLNNTSSNIISSNLNTTNITTSTLYLSNISRFNNYSYYSNNYGIIFNTNSAIASSNAAGSSDLCLNGYGGYGIRVLGNNVGISGNTQSQNFTPAFTLDVNGAINSSSLTTGSIYSTNVTSTNIVSTTSTIPNIVHTNISTSNLNASNITIGNLFVLNNLNNYIGTSVGNASLNIKEGGNQLIHFVYASNTCGSLTAMSGPGLVLTANNSSQLVISSSGNVGINTSVPAFSLDVSGTSRITTSLTTGALFSTNLTSTNIVGTNISATSLYSSLISSANISLSGNITVGGNLIVQGTLISVNVTSLNVINNNITTGSLNANSITTSSLYASQLRFNNLSTSGILFGPVNGSYYSSIYDDGQFRLWTDDEFYINIGGSNTNGVISGSSNIVYVNSSGMTLNTQNLQVITLTGTNLRPAWIGSTYTGITFGTNYDFGVNLLGYSGGSGYNSGQQGGLFRMSTENTLFQWYGKASGTDTQTSIMTLSNSGTLKINGGAQSLQISPTSNGSRSSIGFWQNTSNSGINWEIGHGYAGSGYFNLYNSAINTNCMVVTTQGNTLFSNGFSSSGGTGTLYNLTAYAKLIASSNVSGYPATSGTIGNAIAFRVRGSDDACLDMGVNTGNGSWLQSTNFSGYNFNYPLMLNPNGGNVGINTLTPNAPLQFSNSVANRKIVLYDANNNDHQYYGFGITSGTLRYQVEHTSASHVFYAATSTTTSNEIFRINGLGNVGIGNTNPSYNLDVNGTTRINTRLDIGGTQPSFNSNTIGQLFLTGPTNNPTGPHVVLSTYQDRYPTLHILNYAHDNISLNFDAYWENGWRNSTTTSYQIYKFNSELQFNYIIGSAGSSINHANAMSIYSTGTVNIWNLSNTNLGTNNLTVGNIINTNSNITNLTVGNIINTNSLNSYITVSNLRLSDNAFLDIDTGPSGNSRLALVKKSGSGPFIASNNTTDLVFAAATTTDAANVGGSYTTTMTLTSKGNLNVNSVSTGNIYSSNAINAIGGFKSYSGTVSITATGTYYISPGFGGYIGKFSVYMDQISSGVWGSHADILMPANSNIRGNLSNISKYEYNGAQISADLQPFGGSNTGGIVSDSPIYSVQVVVNALGAGTTLRWTLTIFSGFN